MKNALMYYYNFDNPTIYRTNGKIYVKNDNDRYIIEEISSIKELDEIYLFLSTKLKNKYYEIIKNKFNNISFEHNMTKYAVIKITSISEKKEKKILEKENIINKNYLLDRSNWYFLWCKKNDYFEYQNTHIANQYKCIDESSDYYIGMAETAISYLNYNTESNSNNYLTLCHKRIKEDNLNNPINLVLDHKERDISEYLKYLFSKKEYNIEIVNNILTKKTYTKEEYIRIFARLLYPSYYFDVYERIVNHSESEDKLKEIIMRVDEYEKYLSTIYAIITKKIKIKKVEWLIGK